MRSGNRSPTEDELAALDEEEFTQAKKKVADLRAQLIEAETWLRKIREAVGVSTNAHALARVRGSKW